MAEDTSYELTALTADIVSAYVSKNNVPADNSAKLSTVFTRRYSQPEHPLRPNLKRRSRIKLLSAKASILTI